MIGELNNLIQSVGVIYAIILLTLICLIASMKIIHQHMKSNHILADSVATNFKGLGDTLRVMMETSKIQFEQLLHTNRNRQGYLSTDLSIDLYRNMAEVHVMKKLRFIGNLLKNNDLQKREEQIKKNIESEFRKITDQGIEQISRYRSVIGDMGKIVEHNIDWEECFAETFEIIFGDFTESQKIYDLKKRMNEWINKIEKKLREYGDCNE